MVGTATTVAEARAWADVGADAVCASGTEAGGHRGTFLGDFTASQVGTLALVPQCVDAVNIPVIAAGGIIAPVIPPSIGMVLYGVAGQVSISKLFLAGIVPGLLMGLSIALACASVVSVMLSMIDDGHMKQ